MEEGNEILNQFVQQGKQILKDSGKKLVLTLVKSPYFWIAIGVCALLVVIAGAFMVDADINGDVVDGYTNVGEYDFSDGEIVDIAIGLHSFIAKNSYAYSCSCNVSNEYKNNCDDCRSCSNCDGISNFGKNTFEQFDEIKCIDCSAFVSWVLNQYLGDDFNARKTSHWFGNENNWNSSTSYKWEKININDIQPGDILWKDGHVGIYIGDGKTVEAGSTRAIRASYSFGSIQQVTANYTFGIRIP